MTYSPHCKVILGGVLGASALAPSEIFSTGFQISDTNFADLPSQTQVDTITSYLRTMFGGSDMNLCGDAYLTSVVVVAIAADGKWRKNTDGSWMKRTGAIGSPIGGYATSSHKDYPVSSVTSFVTVRAGAHGRGRAYWPLPAEVPDSTGHVTAASCTNRASTLATVFHNINTALATGAYMGKVVVASSAGYLTPVTNVRVGDVHDTQRRRRGNLHETYQVATV